METVSLSPGCRVVRAGAVAIMLDCELDFSAALAFLPVYGTGEYVSRLWVGFLTGFY
jgi:hypothetical protein